MRKNYAYIASLCLVVLSCCYIFSCQKRSNVKKDESIPTSAITVFGKPASVYNYTRNPAVRNTNSATAREGVNTIETIYADMNAGSMNTFIAQVKANLLSSSVIPSDVNSVIIYSQEQGPLTDYNLVTGISTTQTLLNGKLHYRLFTVQNKQVAELPDYNVETDIISSTEILFFAKQFGSNTCLLFNVPAGTPGRNSSPSNALAKAIVDKSGQLQPISPIGDPGFACTMCGAPVQGVCIKDIYGFNCSGGPGCSTLLILAKGIETGLLTHETAFDVDKAYAYRDGILKSSIVGKKYISYYYKISYLMSVYKDESVNLSNIANLVNLGSKLYESLNKLTQGNSSDIIISSSFKALANSVINDYKHLSGNTEFQAILADIQRDLDHFEGKTKVEVLSEIQ
jgi:hypothetical protein